MAGKEFKAKARKVQKMSRDGLVEENLRTGDRRRAGKVSDPGERIGERPMEEYTEGYSSGQAAQEDRNLRLNRRGEFAEHTGGHQQLDANSDAETDAGMHSDGVRKRRMVTKRGSSLRETPSSAKVTDAESAAIWSEEKPVNGTSSGKRLKNSAMQTA